MSEFEFQPQHDDVMLRFASAMYYMGIALVVTGVLTLLSIFFNEFSFTTIIIGFAWMAMGAGFYFPVDNFRRITTTEGNDIEEMMTGFKELQTAWILVASIMGIYLLLKILDLVNVL